MKSIKEMIKNTVRLWLMTSDGEVIEDGVADLVRVENNKAYAYYLYAADPDAIKKAEANAMFYNESYVVFSTEESYKTERGNMPAVLGVVFCGDLHGLGGMVKVISPPYNNEILNMARLTVLPALGEENNKDYAVVSDGISLPLLKRSGYKISHKPDMAMIGYTRKVWLLNPHAKTCTDAARSGVKPVTFREYINLFKYSHP